MESSDQGYMGLDHYRKAAGASNSNRAYRGLHIHNFPEVHERIGQIISEHVTEGAQILDLAAGSGAMCQRLLDLGFCPNACDMVPENFRLHKSVPFIQQNLNHQFPVDMCDRFDCVIASDVIEHLENPRHFIRQCRRALRSGGMFIVSTPNVDSAYCQALFLRTGHFHRFDDASYQNGGHITPVPRRILARALNEAGFVRISMESLVAQELPGKNWWRMRLLARTLAALSGPETPCGQTLIAQAVWREG